MIDYKENPKYVLWGQESMEGDPVGFYSRLLELNDTLREYTPSDIYGDIKNTMVGIRQRISILNTTGLDCITSFSEEIKGGLAECVKRIDELTGLKENTVGKEFIKDIESKSHWLGDKSYDSFSEGNKTIGGLK